jgi:hypothetical protein
MYVYWRCKIVSIDCVIFIGWLEQLCYHNTVVFLQRKFWTINLAVEAVYWISEFTSRGSESAHW